MTKNLRTGQTIECDGFQIVEVIQDFPFHSSTLGWDVYSDGVRLDLARYSSFQMAENCIRAGVVTATLGA